MTLLHHSDLYECVQERRRTPSLAIRPVWHIVDGPVDEQATWRPIKCGGGIVFPGSPRMLPAVDICDGCVRYALSEQRRTC